MSKQRTAIKAAALSGLFLLLAPLSAQAATCNYNAQDSAGQNANAWQSYSRENGYCLHSCPARMQSAFGPRVQAGKGGAWRSLLSNIEHQVKFLTYLARP